MNGSRNASFLRSPHKARLNKSAIPSAVSPFVAQLSENVETQRYIARLEDELVELEAELLWASGPLLEESEQLQGDNEKLRLQSHELKRMLESANTDLALVKEDLAKANAELGIAEQRLKIFVPITLCAVVLAIWAWARRSD